MTTPGRAWTRWTTARRIVVAFAAVLLLFALALVVMILALARIGEAEQQVARLDHVKHAGHHAAAMAREQYIHQAHTLLEWNGSHLAHYEEVASAAKAATAHLRAEMRSDEDVRRADEIAALVAESDRRFRDLVVPAVLGDTRSRVTELHEMTERPVEQVVALSEQLNRSLEAASDRAQRGAEGIRARARIAVIGCFALAILMAAGVGAYLMRSISRPVAALRAGAMRMGTGDLSARTALPGNDELAELSRVFDQMGLDLSRHQTAMLEAHRLASIGQVASGVAHEINNPLGVILGYLALLRRDETLVDREELRIIEDEVRQCQTIVAGLLDLARPPRLHVMSIDLADVAREAVARLEESGQSSGVEIELANAGPLAVAADESKLRQIVVNLLSNAVEASRDPAAHRGAIRVDWTRRDGRAYVHVDDRGAGVSADARARLFEPFFTTRARGHGLGLAIARTLARAHQGDIEVASRLDGPGTRATLWLPLDRGLTS